MTTEKRIFLTLAVLFFLLMHWSGWNETSRFTLTRAIVEEGRMETTSFAQETGDRIRIGDHFYLDKAPGISMLALPIHALSVLVFSTERPPENKDILTRETKSGPVVLPTHLSPAERFSMVIITFLLSGLLTVATAYLLFLLSKEFITDKRIQYLVSIGYALGTLAFSQALILQGHATTTFFAFAAFFVGYYTIKKGYFSALQGGILAGILAGVAFLVDYLALFAVAGIGLWFLFSRSQKTFLWYGVAFVAVAALLLVYNIVTFGTPFFLSYAAYLEVEPGESATEIFLEGMAQRYFDPTFLKFYVATIIRLLFMPERGVFFYFPFLFLAIPGIYFLARKGPALAAMILIIFFSLLWFVAMPYLPWWWGGSSFGPRYLTLAMPFLMIPVMFAMRKWHIAVSVFLITVSVLVNVLGLQPPSGLEQELALMDSEEYYTAITSLTVIKNPLADYYWPRFREYGISMPIIQSGLAGRPFDIRSNVPFKGGDFFLSTTPLGFLYISRFIVPFFIIILVLTFIWFGYLKNNFWKYSLIIFVIILAFFLFI